MEQVSLPLVIGLNENWNKKGNHGPVCFSQPGAGSEKNPLNFASISVEYNQTLQSYFG